MAKQFGVTHVSAIYFARGNYKDYLVHTVTEGNEHRNSIALIRDFTKKYNSDEVLSIHLLQNRQELFPAMRTLFLDDYNQLSSLVDITRHSLRRQNLTIGTRFERFSTPKHVLRRRQERRTT